MLLALSAAAVPPDVVPVTRIRQASWRGDDWWGDRLARNRDFIKAHGASIDFAFAGSSSTHFWESAGAPHWATLTNRFVCLNLGYGGDCTQEQLWRFRNGELDGYRAKAVILQIGSNNNGKAGQKVARTMAGIRACMDEIRLRQPQAKIILLSYTPRAVGTKDGDPSKDGGADRLNRETNAELAKLADGQNIFWVDNYEKFLVNGKLPKALSEDYIHPTEKGYKIVLDSLLPLLEQIDKGAKRP